MFSKKLFLVALAAIVVALAGGCGLGEFLAEDNYYLSSSNATPWTIEVSVNGEVIGSLAPGDENQWKISVRSNTSYYGGGPVAPPHTAQAAVEARVAGTTTRSRTMSVYLQSDRVTHVPFTKTDFGAY